MSSNEYINNLIENIPLGIVLTDKKGLIKAVNYRLLDMFGYNADELLDHGVSELFQEYPKIHNALLFNKNIVDEEVYIKARRNKLQLNLSVFSIDDSKEMEDFIYIFNDIRKKRKLANSIMDNHAIYTFDKIISENKDFKRLVEFAKKVADSKSTILITGESGTGKEVFAQSIHNESNRKNERFIPINSAAIPKNLIESELFGYEEGAFTGAKKSGQPGKFELAHRGTIFLDEIGEMPLELQTRLLRVLEEGIVSRIGSVDQIPVDVRIIAASNKNLREEVVKGNFRKDLFYRLNVLPMTILPLRERKEDIPPLIEYFMKKISKKLNKREVGIHKEQMNQLIEYPWPGNVRELENFVELTINLESVPMDLFIKDYGHKPMPSLSSTNDLTLEAIEKNHIMNILQLNGGNISIAAKKLGIGRNTLYRKIEKYKMDCSVMEQSFNMEQ